MKKIENKKTMTNDFLLINNCIFKHTFQWTSSELFQISDFLAESLKANENQRKKITYFTIHFRSKVSLNLHFSTHSTLKKYTPATQSKTFLILQIFQQISAWCQKKTFALHISRHPRTALSKHFENNLYIYVFLRRKIFVAETQQTFIWRGKRRRGEEGGAGRLNNSLGQLAVWAS